MSMMDKVPLLGLGELACFAVYVTLMVQLAPAATLVPQVLVSENSWGSAVMLMLVTLSVPVPVLVKVTTSGEPDLPTTCKGNVRLVGDTVTVGVPAVAPVPVKLTDCGLWGALSLIVIDALRAPVAVGEKVTVKVQVPLGNTLVPQVLVCAKSPGFVPERLILVMFSAAVPVLVNVTCWDWLVEPTAWLANVRLVGESETPGLTPVPVKGTVCGLPVALSVMLTEALAAPVAAGVKVTLMVQLAPPASVAGLTGQVLVWPKSPGFVPERLMLVMLRAWPPLLVNVTACDPLVVPTSWPANVRLVGEGVAVGPPEPVAVPVSVTVCGLPPSLSLTVTAAVRCPDDTVGVKVTLMVHVWPAGTLTLVPTHVSGWASAKSPGSAPVMLTLVILSVVVDVLVSVTV